MMTALNNQGLNDWKYLYGITDQKFSEYTDIVDVVTQIFKGEPASELVLLRKFRPAVARSANDHSIQKITVTLVDHMQMMFQLLEEAKANLDEMTDERDDLQEKVEELESDAFLDDDRLPPVVVATKLHGSIFTFNQKPADVLNEFFGEFNLVGRVKS